MLRKTAYAFSMMFLIFATSQIGNAYGYAPDRLQQKLLPGAKKLGSGHLKYLGWSLYDAALYTKGKRFSYKKPFSLSLRYHLSVKGSEIAKRSIEGMRELGFRDEVRLATWYRKMRSIFPNVKKGTQLTGVFLPSKGVSFFIGRRSIGHIHDPKFGRWFFNIWLSERTRLKGLRRKLLGANY